MVEDIMDGLSSLLPMKTKATFPFFDPPWHMTFQEVHLWQYGCMAKILSVKSHEVFDVIIWCREQ